VEKERRQKEALLTLNEAVQFKIQMLKKFSDAYQGIYEYLSDKDSKSKSELWQRMCVLPKSSLIISLLEKMSIHNVKVIGANPHEVLGLIKNDIPFLDAIEDINREGTIDNDWFQGQSGHLYVVSIDMKGSTKIDDLKDFRWKTTTKNYLRRIFEVWLRMYEGKIVNMVGDEIIACFSTLEQALGYASTECTHIGEIMESINRSKAFQKNELGYHAVVTMGPLSKEADQQTCDSPVVNHVKDYKNAKQLAISKDVFDQHSKLLETFKPKMVDEEMDQSSIIYYEIDPTFVFKKLVVDANFNL
jgi:hypothetical protein